jgi:hypothetical protein
MGFGKATRVDFDYTVRSWKRWWDNRAEETVMVVDTSPVTKRRMKPERKYKKLHLILGLNQDFSEPEYYDDTDLDRAANEALAGTIDWSQYGYAG